MTTKKIVKKRIRYAFKSDVRELCRISGKPPDHFTNCLIDGKILMCNKGYLMYQRSGNLTRIHDIFVSEKRQTIGTQLISRLEKEMIHLGILFLEITIPEENLEASLFLKSLDYIAKLSGNYYVFKKVL